jgi:ribosomal-protein-alanine N-acetyltransferase
MSAQPRIPLPVLRAMRADDLSGIADIELLVYEFPWTEGIFRDCLRVGYCCVVLEGDDELHGYGVMSVAAGEAHLLNLCVHPDRQRFGLGSDLLRYFLGKAREADAGRIFLEVRQTNQAALALYNRAGFKAVGLRRNYYRAPEGREDAIVLSLSIDQDQDPASSIAG